MASYHKQRYDERRAAGLCPKCGAKATVGSLCLNDWFSNVSANHFGTRAYGEQLRDLWDEQEGRCAYTGEVLVPGENASLDHRVPVTRGGSNDVSNVHWTSYRINRMKTDMTEDEFFAACKAVLTYGQR